MGIAQITIDTIGNDNDDDNIEMLKRRQGSNYLLKNDHKTFFIWCMYRSLIKLKKTYNSSFNL